jgi:ribonucleotide reductase beta subunit family protein with ferritin-like domain
MLFKENDCWILIWLKWAKEYFENYNEFQLGINNFEICDYIKYVTDLNIDINCFVKLVLELKKNIEFNSLMIEINLVEMQNFKLYWLYLEKIYIEW